MSNFEYAKHSIAELTQRFKINPPTNETTVRVSFINPFFEALGWDVTNRSGHSEQYKDVVHEDSVVVGSATKAPDYSFRIGGFRKFFVEAKNPSIDVKGDPHPAYQLRRYGWSAKLALSVLTDFEEFALYDCTKRPYPTDKASKVRMLYINCEQYTDKLEDIWDILAKESVLKGSFDRFAQKARGTAEVDVEFLKEIESWRDKLARNLALRNPRLGIDQLNEAVQRVIDRIIFLRMAEDREIEPYGRMLTLVNLDNIYKRFANFCEQADAKYNSGLFDFKADTWTLDLNIDDKVLQTIFKNIYYPESPYEFSVIQPEILGNVYEQFLGKVIRLTSGHRAKVEEKPEVRKAGGVYYTPAYIVEYIVKHTVGRQIEGRSPKQLAGTKKKPPFRVLDMACGSGSFLLGAYQCLLDHCLKWYMDHKPESHKKKVFKDPHNGQWRLTIEERKRILTTHLFGIDIDPQAVEVSKLSLLLKVLEDENAGTVGQTILFHQRALPNLADNIKCGNSLIGQDYFTGKLIHDPDEMKRVNPFDWKQGFPDAMRTGGFDCIIGNPPYIRIQTMKEWAPLEVEIYKELFRSGRTGNYDIYVVFIEQSLKLLNAKGQLGFICPHKFFNSKYGEPVREIIAKGKHLSHVVHFGAQQVFDGATTYTCLLFLNKSPASECRFTKVDDLSAWRTAGAAIKGPVKTNRITAKEWNFAVGPGASLFEKLSAMPHKLGDVADVFVGLQTSADDVYIMDLIRETDRTYRLMSKALSQEWTFEKDLLYPIVSGTDVSRYGHLPYRQYILFPYSVHNERAALIDFKKIQCDLHKTAAYLLENKKRLEGREKGTFRDSQWHRFGRSQNLGIQQRVKLCVPRLVEKLHAAFDHDGSHFLDNVDVGGVTLKTAYTNHGFEYLLGLLNCRLLRWYFPQVSAPFRGNWRSANRQFLSLLPVRVIDFKNAKDKAIHRQIEGLVNSMHILQGQLVTAKSAKQNDVIQRQIDATDDEIDRLVYDLYGLTDKDIAIVEGKD